MYRSGKVAGLTFLILLLTLAFPLTSAYASEPPHDSARPSKASLPQPTATQAPAGYAYVIQPGDTLWDIARAHGLMPEDLVVQNRLDDETLLQPGQTIFVPALPVAIPRKTPLPTPAKTTQPAATPAATRIPVATPPAVATPLAKPAAAPQPGDWAALVVKSMNEKRTAAGLRALAWSPQLAAAAQAHANDCAQRKSGSHVGSDGASLRTRLTRAGYSYVLAGENWANAIDPARAFTMWWDEPPGDDPHRQNIMHSGYREIGIGIARGAWGYYFIADFGSR